MGMDEDVQPGAALATPEAGLDRTDPEAAIAAAASRCSNWDRWGADDVLGTLNFLDEAKRVEGAACVRRGASFSLAQSFDEHGPQKGWRRRTNPVHTMLDTGTDAERASQGSRTGSAAPTTSSSCRCRPPPSGTASATSSTTARPGTAAARATSSPATATRSPASRPPPTASPGAACCSTSAARSAPTASCPTASRSPPSTSRPPSPRRDDSARVGRGDLLLVRTGRLARARREGWGDYAGGAAPGLSFTTAGWLHASEIAGIATDTWGFEVRPNEFDVAFQPLHQVGIPNMGLFLGEMWDLDALAADCAADGVYEFLLVAAPLPVTGAVGAPVNPIAIK